MIVLYKVISILIIFINYSYANDIDIQKQLDAQKEIIDEQAKRIDQLEIIIEELKTVLPRAEINNATINSDKKKENETSIKVEAIPSEMSIGNEKNIIREILDNFLKEQKKYSSFQEGLAAMFACKAAIKAGDPLMREEMQELINRLFSTKHPYYCPHGRPIIIQMSLDELDARFERH